MYTSSSDRSSLIGSAPGASSAEVGPRHGVAVVSTDADWLATVLPYVEAGVRAGDLVVLSCPGTREPLARAALGEQLDRLEFDTRITLLGARAPDAVSTARRYLERAAAQGSGRLRVLADVDFGAEPAGWQEGQRFESVFNGLLGDAPVDVLCVYDQRRLPAEVVRSARATHPVVVQGSRWQTNPAFREPVDYVSSLPVVREPVEDEDPVLDVEDAPGLAALRRRIGEVLAERVPDPLQREDLYLAAAEIAANAFRHGARPVSARVWCDGVHVVCAISDRGTSFRDPTCGYQPAHGDDLSRGGMGLWLARKLWDHVDVVPGGDGLTVRLSTRLHRTL